MVFFVSSACCLTDQLGEKAGVREYWIVSPDDQTLQVHILDGTRYVTSAYNGDATVSVSVLPDCSISLSSVFAG
ncbi:MAG: Uma2 family endonuclease [Treponema sp.]|jgi:Uma2 family endonuclease|nr:Uma2 family endonuclease [Treponema sp.]